MQAVLKACLNLLILLSASPQHLALLAQDSLDDGQLSFIYQGDNLKSGAFRKVYKPLCHAVKKEIELKDDDYEYIPSAFTEYICTNPQQHSSLITRESHMCTFPGFECVQQRSTLTIAKRRKGSESWELNTQRIASACECMLPSLELPPSLAH